MSKFNFHSKIFDPRAICIRHFCHCCYNLQKIQTIHLETTWSLKNSVQLYWNIYWLKIWLLCSLLLVYFQISFSSTYFSYFRPVGCFVQLFDRCLQNYTAMGQGRIIKKLFHWTQIYGVFDKRISAVNRKRNMYQKKKKIWAVTFSKELVNWPWNRIV